MTTHITVRKYSYLFCVNKNIHIYYRHRHTRDGSETYLRVFTPSEYYYIYHKIYPCLFSICRIDIWGINQKLNIKNTDYVCMRTIYEFYDHSPIYDSWLGNDKPNYKISMPKRKQRVGFLLLVTFWRVTLHQIWNNFCSTDNKKCHRLGGLEKSFKVLICWFDKVSDI